MGKGAFSVEIRMMNDEKRAPRCHKVEQSVLSNAPGRAQQGWEHRADQIEGPGGKIRLDKAGRHPFN